MPYLLNLVYLALLVLTFPWFLYQGIRKGKYREGFSAKFLGRAPRREPGRPCFWFHAVSVGEVNLLAPILKQIVRQKPDWECVVSTTTMTGMALARKKYPNLAVFYCPLDFSWAVREAMRRIRPDVLVLAELELWPNLVRGAREAGARIAVINGRLSEHSFRGYRRIRPLVARVLGQIDAIAVQDETYAARFRDLGARPESVRVTGSMKYDGAETDRNNPNTERLRRLAGFAEDDLVFLAGSTQDPEEALALTAFRNLSPAWPPLRLVLVPRHPDRFDAVAKLLDASGIPWQRRTALDSTVERTSTSVQNPASTSVQRRGSASTCSAGPISHGAHEGAPRVLLVDVVGELGAWWGTAQIAFVGGSMGTRGGQNMIEPAAYGAAVSFGPNTHNFRDIVAAMLARDAAVVVHNGDEMTGLVRLCLEDTAYREALGSRARALVAEQLGATDRTFRLLASLVGLGGPSVDSVAA